MTAREFCNLYNYEPDRKLSWAKDCVGVTFTKFDRYGRIVNRRFLSKGQATVSFDISKFVSKYNMENWAVRAVDERPHDPVDFVTMMADNRRSYSFTVAN